MRYQTTVDWSSLLWVHLLTWHCNGTLVNMFVNHFVLFSDRVMLVNLDKWLLLCFTEPWDNERTPIFPFWQRVSWAISGVMGGAEKECTWLYMTVYWSLHSNHTPHARCFPTMATSIGQGTEHRSKRNATWIGICTSFILPLIKSRLIVQNCFAADLIFLGITYSRSATSVPVSVHPSN